MNDLFRHVIRGALISVFGVFLISSGSAQVRKPKKVRPTAPVRQQQTLVASPATPNAYLLGAGTGNLRLREALDTDGDGKADYEIFRPSENTWYIWQSGGGMIGQQWGLANNDIPTPGDFDGDGKGDIAVWRDDTGDWYWINSSNGTLHSVHWGTTGDEPVARDYDGDGKTDLAVVRRGGGQMVWYILRSSDGVGIGIPYGLPTDFTAPGDYDGDGKFDLAVQRPGPTALSNATFYYANSTTGNTTTVVFGLSKDMVVPGDYDGDGKTDIAVVREGATPASNLTWYVLRSSDGVTFGKLYGLTGYDYPVQNDYDGDGKTDLAVWRNTDRLFYTFRSTTSTEDVRQWGLPNDYPVGTYDTH
ncbi:MAG: VCBS repeat-containing protein [Acidobacteria bacterium]|nr:VCBS repeat-containing protein [Acidobacteriota bacterium]